MVGLLYPVIYGYKYEASKIPDLSGKVAIVTGGNSGIGLETVRELLRNGCKVYLAARSEARANEALKDLKSQNLKGEVIWLPLDLQDLESVKVAAKKFSDKEKHLDILFNNAGIMATPYELTKDGIEGQIQTNHIAPFLFTNLLLPKLQASSEPRVVNTSSLGHNFFQANSKSFSSLEAINKNFGSTWKRYGQSKLANILFANGIAEKYPKILANSCHPGNIATGLTRGPTASYGSWFGVIADAMAYVASTYLGIMLVAPQGALTQLYLGTSDEVSKKSIKGKYYQPIALQLAPSSSVTKENADRLWQTSEKILADRGYSLKL